MIGRDVPADHHELVCDGPVRDGHTGQRRYRYGTGHTRHDGDRYPGLGARKHLLVAAREDERITALESNNELARLGPVDEYVVDGVLRHRPSVRDLRGVDDLHV